MDASRSASSEAVNWASLIESIASPGDDCCWLMVWLDNANGGIARSSRCDQRRRQVSQRRFYLVDGQAGWGKQPRCVGRKDASRRLGS